MQEIKPGLLIACGVLAKDIRYLAEQLDPPVDLRFFPGGLHEDPTKLRTKLQETIDAASQSGRWERIIIGYGICGTGTVNLRARSIPLMLPRVHDCIALFLGSDASYREQFSRWPGTYYISEGWYKEKTEPLSQRRPYVFAGNARIHYDELVEKYGEEHAQRIFDFLNSWKRNYQRAAFIDTGHRSDEKCAEHARKMAEEHGWRYERLKGSLSLLTKLLTTTTADDEVLIVPPGQVTAFNHAEGRLTARPPLHANEETDEGPKVIEWIEGSDNSKTGTLQIGLGIDAGGTYTDAVIYDFSSGTITGKHKALTTKWDFSVGIREALGGLDPSLLSQVQLAAVSTTLATNAIVENEGQTVGLLIMPPLGTLDIHDIRHEPKAVIAGQLGINGEVIEPIDDNQVRSIARRMTERQAVAAFAVSGYAGCINPEQELKVKDILRGATGCFVICGHELSRLLNFRVRAETAVLNARIVPRIVRLLQDIRKVLASVGVKAPMMVVKGDGTLMSCELAMERPVETILSGPAASVAGARFLTNKKNAIVVDMGGTTTDTASLEGGGVRICESGSRVGGIQTHVKALEIRTTGLGGDSLITYHGGQFEIGPRRMTPVAWLGRHCGSLTETFEYLRKQQHRYKGSSRRIEIIALAAQRNGLDFSDGEKHLLEILEQRPHSMDELVERTGALFPGALPLRRLDEHHMIYRSGVTPTDLLHVKGQFKLWDLQAARELCDLLAHSAGMKFDRLVHHVFDLIVRRLTLELIKKQLDEESNPEKMDSCEVCQALLRNLFENGSKNYSLRLHLHRPVIGVGAPISTFLPRAAELLGTEALMPKDRDVANAVGAITSHVSINDQLSIKPAVVGGYVIEGLAGTNRFGDLEEAQGYATQNLIEKIRIAGRAAGTSQTMVSMQLEDLTTTTSKGDRLFLERKIRAHLVGTPDLLPGA